MARLAEELEIGWRHLAAMVREGSERGGWRTISIGANAFLELRAARRSTGNEEALLAGFHGVKARHGLSLPEGEGFDVEEVSSQDSNTLWLAVTRKEPFSVELFLAMAADVASTLQRASGLAGGKLIDLFVKRVREWQEFMRKSSSPMSPEEELGLVGELQLLAALLDLGLLAAEVLQAWEGPLDGIHDFALGSGAIEVKSSVSGIGFRARIQSLEQLDDTMRAPLFLAAVRMRNDPKGSTLPQHVRRIRGRVMGDMEAERLLMERLMSVGFSDAHDAKYVRTFDLVEIGLIEVTDGFPRLIPSNVPSGVRQAVYDIELSLAAAEQTPLSRVIKRLGVI